MDPFIGEIRVVPFNFAPAGWALCDGQLLPLAQNTALFSLLGTTYGGNGTTNFALPNLQARVPVHAGQGPGLSPISLGQTGGLAAVTLTAAQVPVHGHSAARAATTNRPVAGTLPADGGSYAPASVAGAQPHDNMPPYLVLYFVIALQGVFPPRS
jgi:microcystin-dependent protein